MLQTKPAFSRRRCCQMTTWSRWCTAAATDACCRLPPPACLPPSTPHQQGPGLWGGAVAFGCTAAWLGWLNLHCYSTPVLLPCQASRTPALGSCPMCIASLALPCRALPCAGIQRQPPHSIPRPSAGRAPVGRHRAAPAVQRAAGGGCAGRGGGAQPQHPHLSIPAGAEVWEAH